MTFTPDQLKTLQAYEHYFHTALHSGYASYPGQFGVKTIYEIFASVAKQPLPELSASCSSCIFRLLRDVGTLYFEDMEEMSKKKRRRRNEI